MMLDAATESTVRRTLNGAPLFEGRPIQLRFLPDLRRCRGKLVSGSSVGEEVHAAADLERRVIILDRALTSSDGELRRILLHEIFHFVWRRLSTQARRGYEAVIAKEFTGRARGELGWSSEMRKRRLAHSDTITRSRRWREYLCESFCDTASWVYSEMTDHPEFTLAPRFSRARRKWLVGFVSQRASITV
jgi:hypothetical protein